MKTNPLVSINILSFNRKDDLKETLQKVFTRDYENIEVIVVDNSSTDDSVKMIKEEFPEVKLIELKENIGIAGWNEGFKISKGEYNLVLDDDSYPEKKTIAKAVDCIQSDKKIGVVALPVFNKRFENYETEFINKVNPNTFIGCGALIKKSVFAETGYFSELLFLYEHEIEFSMRVINAGYKIKFCVDAVVVHTNSVSNRIIKKKFDHRRKYYLSRNYLLILFMHFSLINILIFAPQLVISRLIMAISEKNFFTTLSGFLGSLKYLPQIIGNRKQLNKTVQKFYRSGNYMGRFVKDRAY